MCLLPSFVPAVCLFGTNIWLSVAISGRFPNSTRKPGLPLRRQHLSTRHGLNSIDDDDDEGAGGGVSLSSSEWARIINGSITAMR